MSCSENESGPFVVFFLPALVGCLTILLARRWTNSQVNNISSTGVSRRRKIIKDPSIKRTLPPFVFPKMVQPGSKKVGMAKKGSYLVTDEDLNGSGKRVKRHSPSSAAPSQPSDVKVPDGPFSPKHIPFPYIPQDGELLFETMSFVFVIVATGLQFLNLYRTAWWLPHSQTKQAVNWYLIDRHVVALAAAASCRRVLLAAARAALARTLPDKALPHALAAARMFILGVVLGAMAWCAYFIFLKHPVVKLFYLCYPAVIYFTLFGLQVSPFLELGSNEAPMHSCSLDPAAVRAEVETFREDFNMRAKKIFFNSVFEAYYSCFVPLCFAQSYLYYDVYSASQQVVLVWGTLFGRYCTQLLPAGYCDTLHRAALHLAHRPQHGESGEGSTPTGIGPGQPLALWASWLGRSRAPPLAPAHAHAERARFYAVFINPSLLLCLILCLELSLIALHLCLMFSTTIPWHHFLSIVIILFVNYYTMFKMVRDYLIAWKVYKAEYLIQEKHYSPVLAQAQG